MHMRCPWEMCGKEANHDRRLGRRATPRGTVLVSVVSSRDPNNALEAEGREALHCRSHRGVTNIRMGPFVTSRLLLPPPAANFFFYVPSCRGPHAYTMLTYDDTTHKIISISLNWSPHLSSSCFISKARINLTSSDSH